MAGAGGGLVAGGVGAQPDEMKVQPINRALEELLQGQQRQQLRQNTDFEWTSNQTLNMYHTGGWRQAMSAVERRDEAVKRLAQLQTRAASECHLAAWRRWRWAVEMASSGRGLSLKLVLPSTPNRNMRNPVAQFFSTVPLGILRKVFAAESLRAQLEAAQAELVAAGRRAADMSHEALALQLGSGAAAVPEMARNRASRVHYERQLIDGEREVCMRDGSSLPCLVSALPRTQYTR